MRRKALRVLTCVVCLSVSMGIAVYAKKTAAVSANFSKPIARKDRIAQALNRLTFGARPGDAERVRKIGLKKWIDLQLHPERISENPVLAEKLKPFDTLTMPSDELVRNYPAPQIVRQMVAGQIPFPTDPDRRMMIQRLVARDEKRQAAGGQVAPPPPPGAPTVQPLTDILTPEQIRVLRTAAPQERLAMFQSLAPDKQDDVIAALPAGIRQTLYAAAPPDVRRKIEMSAGPAQGVARDLMESKILRAVYSSRQLDEVLADFWFNHFNVFLDKGADRYLITEYDREAIRPHVLGKFRDLLEATAKSPAMLFYLDNWQSVGANVPLPRGPNAQRRGLNENYGRELLELHTLGVDGGYTQKDVTEAARCFTGWTIRQPQRVAEFEFNPRMHDDGEKTVLGVRIPAGGGIDDGFQVLHLLAHHPSTARFISRKLAMRFVADDPPETLVNRMAATFLKKDGDLRAVLKTMFDSPEFWSRGAYRAKMKSPLEMVASSLRAVDAQVDFAFGLNNQLNQLGEPLYRKAEPTGYSNSGQEWLNSAGLLARMNFSIALVNNKVPGVKVDSARSSEGVTLGSPDFQKR